MWEIWCGENPNKQILGVCHLQWWMYEWLFGSWLVGWWRGHRRNELILTFNVCPKQMCLPLLRTKNTKHNIKTNVWLVVNTAFALAHRIQKLQLQNTFSFINTHSLLMFSFYFKKLKFRTCWQVFGESEEKECERKNDVDDKWSIRKIWFSQPSNSVSFNRIRFW